MQAVDTYGYDWLAVEEFVGTRTLKQITNYALKEFGEATLKSIERSHQLSLINTNA